MHATGDGVAVIELTPGPLADLAGERATQLASALARPPPMRPAALLVLAPDGLGADEPRVPTPRGLRDPAAVLAAFPAPTVAVWNGPAIGAGAELVLAADVRVIGPDATMAFPEVGAGALPCWGGTQRLPRAGGAALALRMLVIGDTADATMLTASGLAVCVADPVREGADLAARLALGRAASAGGGARRGAPWARRHARRRAAARVRSQPVALDHRRPRRGHRRVLRQARAALHRRMSTAVLRGPGRRDRARRRRATCARRSTCRSSPRRAPAPTSTCAPAAGLPFPPPGRLLRAADGWVHPGPPTVWDTFTAMAISLGAAPPATPGDLPDLRALPAEVVDAEAGDWRLPAVAVRPERAAPAPVPQPARSATRRATRSVVVLGTAWAVPLAGLALARLGARVVRVENPRREDPFPLRDVLARGQARVALDLDDAADRDAFVALLESADLIVDGNTPRVLANVGLDDDALRRTQPAPLGRAARGVRATKTDPGYGLAAECRGGWAARPTRRASRARQWRIRSAGCSSRSRRSTRSRDPARARGSRSKAPSVFSSRRRRTA